MTLFLVLNALDTKSLPATIFQRLFFLKSKAVTRFGSSAPLAERLIEELSAQRGETIAPSTATSANALGLTTQVPVRAVYLTSGRTRKLTLGKQVIELQHAPSWQLTFAKEPAGQIVRALAWAGPERVQEVLKEIERKVPWSELHKVNQHISLFPIWMARALCQSDSYTATVKT